MCVGLSITRCWHRLEAMEPWDATGCKRRQTGIIDGIPSIPLCRSHLFYPVTAFNHSQADVAALPFGGTLQTFPLELRQKVKKRQSQHTDMKKHVLLQ